MRISETDSLVRSFFLGPCWQPQNGSSDGVQHRYSYFWNRFSSLLGSKLSDYYYWSFKIIFQYFPSQYYHNQSPVHFRFHFLKISHLSNDSQEWNQPSSFSSTPCIKRQDISYDLRMDSRAWT